MLRTRKKPSNGRPGTCTSEKNAAENDVGQSGWNPGWNRDADLPPKLAEVVAAWDRLSEPAKAEILAIVRRES